MSFNDYQELDPKVRSNLCEVGSVLMKTSCERGLFFLRLLVI